MLFAITLTALALYGIGILIQDFFTAGKPITMPIPVLTGEAEEIYQRLEEECLAEMQLT